jgi:PAS domain S-box-containing protein
MVGRPFGVDEVGRPLNRTKGNIVRATVEYMLECVSQRAAQDPLPGVSAQERQAHVEQARAAALKELVERLNAVIADPRYHVTDEYLLNEGNAYSVEFDVFMSEICRNISGDPRFHFNRGSRSIPSSVAQLGRPFSLRQVFSLLPRLAGKMADTEFRVVRTTESSAVIQWYCTKDLACLPPSLHYTFINYSCQYIQGAFSSIPKVHSGLPMASIRETRCQLKGDECCEWEFAWQNRKPGMSLEIWGGATASVIILAYVLLLLPAWQWMAIVGAFLPAIVGVLVWRTKVLRYEREQQGRLLLEQRESGEKQYDDLQETAASLQLSNVTLQHRLSELMALHQIGSALSAMLNLEELLDRSLHAVTTHLSFDRATILLVDEEQQRLGNGRMIGGTPEMVAQVEHLSVSLDDSALFLAQVLRSGQPMLVDDVHQVSGERVREFLETLQTSSFLAVPLITQGKVVGALMVDNALTGRPIPENNQELLLTAGAQIAATIENARLHQTLEQRVEQRTAELAESQRRLVDIINFSPDATLVIDQEGRVIAWNQAIEEMTGIKAQEMLGKANYEYAVPFYGERRPILIDLVLHPEDDFERKYTHLRKGDIFLAGETYVPNLKGHAAYLFATASALRDSRGNIVGAIESIRDISERKQMEEDMRRAREAAEAATQAKSAFLATMSHEIRTPMNAVIGMTTLLLDTELTPEQQEFVETIRTSGDALLTIINDILDFSKIEAGRMELESQPFDLRECVESALDLLASKAAEKNLNLAYVISENMPVGIIGDMTRLRQILVNLLSNACKFTEQGEIVVSVDCAGDNGPPPPEDTQDVPAVPHLSMLHFSVRDTGVGIPPDRIGRLFRSFSQVDASTTRRYGGTGLGLAISKRLSELMGGRMWVESEGIPGKGSTFHFTIRAEAAPPVAMRAYLQGVHPGLNGKRVLIVDDNATNRRILTLQTRSWGMLPRDIARPHEALQWIQRGDPFDVALLDMQMPEMDGLALAMAIRRLRAEEILPLVMLTSLGRREADVDKARFAAFLTKPIKASQLYDVLVGIFGTQEQVPDLAPPKVQLDRQMGAQHPLRILLAEDNSINQKLALKLLDRMGYRADVANNGLEVLAALRRQPYDVVLMDVQMPEMDGLEATRAICQEWPRERRPRIIATTANAMKEDCEICLAAGMDDYLSKPIRTEELVRALNACKPIATPAVYARPEKSPSTTTGASRATVLDQAALARLRELSGGDKAFVAEMIATFQADSPDALAEMRQGIERGDAALLRRAAHTLKSNSADFGALVLSALCRELEMMGKEGNLNGAEQKLAQIEAEYVGVHAALAALSASQ